MQKYVVTEYTFDQPYGGPEEGGWWHDRFTFRAVVSQPMSKDDAIEMQGKLCDQVVEENNRRKADGYKAMSKDQRLDDETDYIPSGASYSDEIRYFVCPENDPKKFHTGRLKSWAEMEIGYD